MFGLSRTSGFSTSLLLNLEGVATAVIAVLFFKENAGKRLWRALVCMTTAGVFLAWDPNHGEFNLSGPLMILLSMVCWGIDNNISVHEIALRSSEEMLKSSSSLIWITLANSLRHPPLDRALFEAAARKHSKVEVAYLALYDANGKIVMHSNGQLVGTMRNEPGIIGLPRRMEEPQVGYRTLADGTALYVMDMTMDIRDVEPSPLLLRVALHPSSALADVRQAKGHIVLSLSLIAFLWLMAWFFFRFSRRIEMLRYERIEREHLVC